MFKNILFWLILSLSVLSFSKTFLTKQINNSIVKAHYLQRIEFSVFFFSLAAATVVLLCRLIDRFNCAER